VSLDLLAWRRTTAETYRQVRACADPAAGHALWVRKRAELFARSPQSPSRTAVLRVAPYDPSLRAEVALEPAPPARLEVPTGTDGVVPFERIGLLRTPWGPLDAWWLASYGGGLWLPVAGGRGAYGGGRYLLDTVKGADLGSTADGRLVVDLNFLYNPSCAYDEAWACPLAPPGNRLVLDAEVGELLPGP
jgi:uncharacterized protein (DUF1684 family)